MEKDELVLFVIKTAARIDGRVKLARMLLAANYHVYKGGGGRTLDVEPGDYAAFEDDVIKITESLQGRGLVGIHRGTTAFSYSITPEGDRAAPGGDGALSGLVKSLAGLAPNRIQDAVLEMFPELGGGMTVGIGGSGASGSQSSGPPGPEFGFGGFGPDPEYYLSRHPSYVEHGDMEQRMLLMDMFGWDMLPEQTNPDPSKWSDLLSEYSGPEKGEK